MDNLDTVKVTSKGKKYLKKPESFKVVEDNDFSDMEMEPQIKGGAACVTDPALYSMLKDLRKKMAKKLNLPPYVISRSRRLRQWQPPILLRLKSLQTSPEWVPERQKIW